MRAHVRQPMIAIIERLADDLRACAPELVASPKVSMYRIYRDTRFSETRRRTDARRGGVSDARPAQARGRRLLSSRPTKCGLAAACARAATAAVREHVASTSSQFRIRRSRRAPEALSALGVTNSSVCRGSRRTIRRRVSEVPAVHRRGGSPGAFTAVEVLQRCSPSSARSSRSPAS